MTQIAESFFIKLEKLIRKVPAAWLIKACETLKFLSADTPVDGVCRLMPGTLNSDLSFLAEQVIREADQVMSWEALGWILETNFQAHRKWMSDQSVELLWSGPSPVNEIPVRRIDQSLYDLIAAAKYEILLVTFAAAKIQRLAGSLIAAVERGLAVRLLLEFEQESEGQLSFDALKAFPSDLVRQVEVYCWPLEKRARNQAGKPGKLHAKLALIDDQVIVSSANLTDDAFNRNLELGVLVQSKKLQMTVKRYVEGLVIDGVIERV
ncbi:DISARM system phospholipase D-like protein DrmC [Pseudomonas rhodesiae]|uniref:DISARM system phospholipase D-like protein DrmC n=1 Tax=Pseudomonas rhodesiae TaxID=76760 RepID=UPI001ABF3A6E|nr:DISARM system phospholipase D-like protein DrmC [Pseudomonas rhodesiae]